MQCPKCHGNGFTFLPERKVAHCPYCDGAGEIDCCEGSERHGQLTSQKCPRCDEVCEAEPDGCRDPWCPMCDGRMR